MIFSIILILNFFVLVELNKENLEHVSTPKENSWVDVQKRLDIGSKQDRYGCRTLNLNSTIIMAHASLNNGASYIPGPSVSSAHECASACCDMQECNVAVYKLKGSSGLCYLFNCGTDTKLCNFTRLEGYVSMKLDDHSKDLKSQIESNDFESQLPQVPSKIVVNNATLRQPNIDSTTMLLPSEKSLQVPLFGSCDTNSDCAITASECVVSFCLCRKGYHAQNGLCLPSPATDGQQSAQYAPSDNKNAAKQHTNKKTTDRTSSHIKGEKTTTEASIKPTTTTLVTQSTSSTFHESITSYPASKTELPKTNLLEIVEIEEGAKSAMIILILGLLLTFIMLVLIGCRLRTMKMKLRRGASLSSQEADYLINGMYL